MLNEDETVRALQAVGRGLDDRAFLVRLLALLTKHEITAPNLPTVRAWQIEAVRQLRRQGVRRADLRMILIHRFDIGETEAERLIERAAE